MPDSARGDPTLSADPSRRLVGIAWEALRAIGEMADPKAQKIQLNEFVGERLQKSMIGNLRPSGYECQRNSEHFHEMEGESKARSATGSNANAAVS